ncbi:Flp pilus assembly complex ATPase component TadA [Candidatus Woesearchaeota archaeon]|nr:Flp pilus assembly complex ATPase component TadA [Candidatus Woesearchaeota archaeon]
MVEISLISKPTELILEKIRQELIRRVNLGITDISDIKKTDIVEEKFDKLIRILIQKYFPDANEAVTDFLSTYLSMKTIGLGKLEIIMGDENLEEVVINQASEPVWVYHKKYGWLKTNIYLENEDQTKHYASIIGRRVGRQINVANPLLDAHLKGGDRVNATLVPISTAGHTITIRKFSKDPWTITKFLKTNTITPEAAALIWSAIQYELSAIIAGGTASGKTSTLNAFASFFPPNQRIISIEDTREITLPKYLHWVPLNTSLPNAEGKGEISMGDLLVNSLRMRPDRVLVGEVRRKKETETLFEAIHTGHSVYATFHANSAREVVDRLTNPPLDVPKIMLPAISLIIVQFRNRRTGKRRTFQIAEITEKGEARVLQQYDPKKDKLVSKGGDQIDLFLNSKKHDSTFYETIKLFTGMDNDEITKDLNEKVKILKYLIKNDITEVDEVGKVIAEYYTDKNNLMRYVNANQKLTD